MGFEGEVYSDGAGDRGRLQLMMRIGENGDGWQIDSVFWKYWNPPPPR